MKVTINEVRLYCRIDAKSGEDRWFFELPGLGDMSDYEPYLTIVAAMEGVLEFITSRLVLEPEIYKELPQ